MEKLSINPAPLSTMWIENLALEELNMDEAGVVNINDHLGPSLFLEESSIEFMNLLRERFEIYTTKFNEFRGGANSGSLIKIFKISNTVNDFMLFRNSLRLVFARKSNDLISIGFLVNGKDIYAPRLTREEGRGAKNQTHDIRAHIGPFNNISWRFNGEPVDIDTMVRYYLSEFIRQSAR